MGRLRKLFLPAAMLASAAALTAQLRVQPVAEHPGEAALRLMLRKLASAGTFMQTTAHPDDEDNGLLAMLGHGRGMRAVLVTATRGDGGQNEIGPELFEALSVLRTEELLAAHRIDGAEQYFTRAIDFGYSFSVDESLRLWGHEEILGDFVRHIRAVRPDVIAGFLCGGAGGGQHHQASTQLTREAFRAAADPGRFPDQIAEGLRPWAASRLFCTDLSSFMGASAPGGPRLLTVADRFDPLIGRRYEYLGIEARSMHKCQGTSQLLPRPGESFARTYRLEETRIGPPDAAPADMYAGIDTTLPGLAAYAGRTPPGALKAALQRIADLGAEAERRVDAGGQSAALPQLAAGLTAIRTLRKALPSMALARDARFEIDFRLEQKERQFAQALVLAQGLRLETLAEDGLVASGQTIKLSVLGSNGGEVDLLVKGVSVSGFDGSAPVCSRRVAAGGSFACEAELKIGALPPTSAYWKPRSDAARYEFEPGVPFGVPFHPSPFRTVISLEIAGVSVTAERAVEFRYGDVTAGEKRMELHVVPRLAVTLGPDIVVIPRDAAAAAAGGGREASRTIEVTVVNHERGASRATVSVQAPRGWRVAPDRVPMSFSREDESATVRFDVVPPPGATAGEYGLSAVVDRSGAADEGPALGYQVIEYPHVHRRHLVQEARTRVKIVEVTLPANVDVGYIVGVGDRVPQAIEQLGATLHFIEPDDLAAGDLSRYDVIVTGVRAYERRADLRAHNHRLIEFAAAGGTVIVQYNKFEFNQAQYGPFPATVSAERVTDENAPVEVLAPDHPVFNTPNRLGPEVWSGWVQERGLYFLGKRDPRYVDLVRLVDPFEYNPGQKTGALVEARVGRGRWIYLGLGLWRQLPAGTDGAYRILANLLALGSPR